MPIQYCREHQRLALIDAEITT